MAFTVVATGAKVLADHVTEIQDALQGVSGRGVRIQTVQVNDASNYSVDIRNLDTTNSYGLRVRDGTSTSILTAYKNNVAIGNSGASDTFTINAKTTAVLGTLTAAANMLGMTGTWNSGAAAFNGIFVNVTNTASAATSRLIDLQAASTSIFSVSPAGLAFIGDSANAQMTVGLTINQAGNDNEIISLKSSDVAHGMTDTTETDTYGFCIKHIAAEGKLRVVGLSSGTGGIILDAYHTTDDTTKSAAGHGAIQIVGRLKSGTGATFLGANANIASFETNGATRFILDADGDSHQDVGTAWTNFDEYDDVALLNHLSRGVSRPDDPIRREFGEFLAEHRTELERAHLVTFNDDGHHFVNMSRLTMLLVGALRQLSKRLEAAETHLALQGG